MGGEPMGLETKVSRKREDSDLMLLLLTIFMYTQISSGFNPKIKKDPYKGFVYTSFQERATKISHQNVARLANNAGDGNLGLICSKIAGDESRHEKAYQAIFKEILNRDPEGGLKSFYELMTDQVKTRS